MKKEELLNSIENQLDTFQLHVKKIKNSTYKLHPVDIDLLRKKTIDIYEQLNNLDLVLQNAEEDFHKTINLPDKMPKAEIPEQALAQDAVEKEVIFEKDQSTKNKQPETFTKIEETQTPSESLPTPTSAKEIKPEAEVPSNQETKTVIEKHTGTQPKKEPDTQPEENQTETGQPPYASTESDDPIQSAFDLFTSNAEETIGDKLSAQDESSIADKMQKTQVNDLRQVIGINEKFLFINELFNGDMGRYNKVIDELNELKNQQGINAYLIELKVSNQWSEDNEAFNKLTDLLDRKIN